MYTFKGVSSKFTLVFDKNSCLIDCPRMVHGLYSLSRIKLSEKSAEDQIRITKNSSTDLWLKSVYTKKGSVEPKKFKNVT